MKSEASSGNLAKRGNDDTLSKPCSTLKAPQENASGIHIWMRVVVTMFVCVCVCLEEIVIAPIQSHEIMGKWVLWLCFFVPQQRLRREHFDFFCSRLFENVFVVAWLSVLAHTPEHSIYSNHAVENKGTFATVFQDVMSVLSSLSVFRSAHWSVFIRIVRPNFFSTIRENVKYLLTSQVIIMNKPLIPLQLILTVLPANLVVLIFLFSV